MNKKTILALLCSLMLLPLSVWSADEEAMEMQPSYVSLGKPMVLNLSSNGKRLSFLQVSADVLVKDDNAKEVVEIHVPAIRHKLIVLLSEQLATDMKSPVKREEIRKQATSEIRDMIGQMASNQDIEEVLFSQFLVQ